MARIRTVKPDLFKHEALAEAEATTGLPLRLVFIGLFTQADREGRFVWRPRVLKTDILPYDATDFEQVLDALAEWGFVVRYMAGGKEIGCIPSFPRHQVINHREAASILPPPPDFIEQSDVSVMSEPRGMCMPGHARWEGKGKEGKGTIEPSGSVLSEPVVSDGVKPRVRKVKSNDYTPEYETFWKAYPSTQGQSKLNGFRAWRNLSTQQQAQAKASLPAYAALLASKPDREVKHVQGYLNGLMFETMGGSTVAELETPEQWRKRLAHARTKHEWHPKWGVAPGKAGCRVPTDLLQHGDGEGWSTARAA